MSFAAKSQERLPSSPDNPSVQALSGRRRREASSTDILDATERLLIQGIPVAQLSVRQILDESGISRSTFYACFVDKHAVIAGLARRSLAWRYDVSGEDLGDPSLTRERLADLMRAVIGHWRQNRAVLAAIIEVAEHDLEMQTAWREAIGEIGAQTADQLNRRWAQGPGSLPDPDAVGLLLAWTFERAAHHLALDDQSAERTALALAEVLWRTVAYRP